MTFRAVNPATGVALHEVPPLAPSERVALIARVHREQQQWRRADHAQRARFVQALGVALQAHREALAEWLSLEMGKPIVAARAEVDKCVSLCEQAPALARAALADDVLAHDAINDVRIQYAPLGTVLAIMPWNFPYWQALRFAVPTLLAGNGVLIKPAGSVPGGARLLDDCFVEARAAVRADDAAVPDAPCHMAFIEVEALDSVIADARIAGVTLTGSDRAGRHVASVAGTHLKKVVLELGGSDPFIVLPDADIAVAAAQAVAARTVNSGQSCIAAKRFIVCDAVYDDFLARFVDGMRALRVGDPRDEATQIGPIATESVRDGLAKQVQDSIAAGARALVGGAIDGLAGFFYPPTVLVDIPDDAPASREELFGPVASVFRVADVVAAIAKANDTPFGLGASVWTRDPAIATQCIEALDVGMVFVNEMVVSDPRYPFGGVKQSGMGRELGPLGFREFTNPKAVRRGHLPEAPR
ncbi:aldehyde dehydrogenase family protein [Gemmatimonas sp.]|uniref:aldehyde dehydrogenase family protein n=1 Tax=Gemmatimonas sp. TaxID=1962908 RepID=UPI003983AA75